MSCNLTNFISAAALGGMYFTALAQAASADDQTCQAGSFTRPIFILRQDFNDVPVLTCVHVGDAAAVGSRISFTSDRVAKTESLSIDGLAAIDLQYDAFNAPFLVDGIAFGPFVQGAGMRSFATNTTPVAYGDTLTGGGFVELSFKSFDPSIPNLTPLSGFLRLHGGELTSNLGVRDPSFVAELIPVFGFGPDSLAHYLKIGNDYNFVHIDGGAQDIQYLITPELEFQYDQSVAGPRKFKIFSTNVESERIGPALNIRASYGLFSVAFGEHYSVDTVSGRTYNLIQSTLSYNLDMPGHFAISASYAYGNSDATGNLGSQFKVSLAVKN